MVLPVAAAYIRTTRHSAGAQPVSHHCSARPWVGHVEGRLAEVPSSVANQRRCLPQDPLPAPSIGGAEGRFKLSYSGSTQVSEMGVFSCLCSGEAGGGVCKAVMKDPKESNVGNKPGYNRVFTLKTRL